MSAPSSWKLNEIVTTVIISLGLSVVFWGWTFVSALAKPLEAIGLSYLLAGVWFLGGTLVPFLIRRPGSALLGELLAAIVEGFITQWGITAGIWGLVQGLGCELVFLATGYKRFDRTIMIVAGMTAGLFSYALDFFYSAYWGLQPWVWGVQLVSIMAGGALWAGVLAYAIGRGIVGTGAAASLRSGHD